MPSLCACFSRGVPAASSSSPGGTGILRGVANRLGASFKLRFSSAVGAARYYQDDFPTLVNPAYLESRLKDQDQQQGGRKLHVLDCTWYLPNQNRSAADEFMTQGRIVGAKFFDLDAVADTTSSLPHMLPSEGAFAAAMDALGIKPEDGTYCILHRAFTYGHPVSPSQSHCLRSYSCESIMQRSCATIVRASSPPLGRGGPCKRSGTRAACLSSTGGFPRGSRRSETGI